MKRADREVQAKRRKQNQRSYPRLGSLFFRWAIPVVLLCVLITGLVWVWDRITRADAFPIEHVVVNAPTKHLSPVRLKQVVESHLAGGFFSLDGHQIKQVLMEDAWIDSVELVRHWPDTLVVNVRERQPVAQWGQSALITQEGGIFKARPETFPQGLVVLQGPEAMKQEMIHFWQSLLSSSEQHQLVLDRVSYTSKIGYQLFYQGGLVVVLGKHDVKDRFDRLMAYYDLLLEQRSKPPASVDMRYHHGFAVKWH